MRSLVRVRELVDARPLLARLAACGLFVAAALAFLLPFTAANADSRVGEATGLALARGEPSLSGRYVHGAFEGEVERVFAEADGPALAALLAALAGALLAWLPWRTGPALGLAAAVASAGALYVLHQTAGTAFAEAQTRYGFWAAVLANVAAGGWTLALVAWSPWWWRPSRDEGRRDYFAPPEG